MSKATKWAGVMGAGLLLLSSLPGCVASVPEQPATSVTFVMNTVVEYELYGPDEQAEEAIQAIDQALRDLENRMSLYLEDSEIQRLNAAAGNGEWIPLSEDTFDLLKRAKEFGDASGGIFDITIAPLTELWGVTSEHPQVPSSEEIQQALALVDYRGLELDESLQAARLTHAGMAVDLGGAAKGYACDVARKVAQQYEITSGYLSIGGNLMVIGQKPDGKQFTFGLRDPRGSANEYIATISLPDSTMATSGDYERFFEQDGIRYHHILDPDTGYPSNGGLMSVSVVTPDGALADFLSTTLFILGRDAALEQLNNIPGCGLILVDTDKNVYLSDSLKEWFTPADSTGSYQFEVPA